MQIFNINVFSICIYSFEWQMDHKQSIVTTTAGGSITIFLIYNNCQQDRHDKHSELHTETRALAIELESYTSDFSP